MEKKMSLPYDDEALWMKAKTFINRSFDALEDDFPLAALWAANSLELLAKSVLCKINPLLVADPSDEGRSLMLAAGLPGDRTQYKSISAKTLYSRCDRAFKSFSKEKAAAIAVQRNAELHSGANPFNELTDKQLWWEQFWSTAAVLIDERGCMIEEFVGPLRVADVQEHLERNIQSVHHRVSSLVAKAKQRLESGQTPQQLPSPNRDLSISISCPVCEDIALLGGDNVEDSELVVEVERDGLHNAYELVQVWSDFFQCENCGLMIEGEAHIGAAGLDQSFEVDRPYVPDFDDLYDYANE